MIGDVCRGVYGFGLPLAYGTKRLLAAGNLDVEFGSWHPQTAKIDAESGFAASGSV